MSGLNIVSRLSSQLLRPSVTNFGFTRNLCLGAVLRQRRLRGKPSSQIVASEFLAVPAENTRQESVNFAEIIGDQRRNPFNPALSPEEVRYDEGLLDLSPEESRLSQEISKSVNAEILQESHGRLFAVVHMGRKQWRVTEEDIIMLTGTYHLALGQKIKIDKVLAVGSANFTLIGRPLLDRGLVNIEATCIEKTHSYPIIYFRHLKQIPLRKYRFNRVAETMVRINRISFNRRLNDLPDPEDVVYNIH